jgi:hypothetical protein
LIIIAKFLIFLHNIFMAKKIKKGKAKCDCPCHGMLLGLKCPKCWFACGNKK